MRTAELFRTCSNEHVAAAAVACIGGKFKRRVTAAARRAGVPAGAYVVELLADYDRRASPNSRSFLERDMVRQDMPILAGLRHVVETVLEQEARGSAPVPARETADEQRLRWRIDTHPLLRCGSDLKPLHS
jgi:hypothetical protein